GALLAGTDLIGGAPAADWVAACAAELKDLPEVRVLRRTTAFGYYDHNYLALLERVADHLAPGDRPADGPRQRLWKVRAKEVVLASGAIERPLVFADNDRPGIMLAGAVRTYINRYGVKPGARAVVVTNNDSAYACASDLVRAGVTVAAVVDARATPDGPHVTALRAHGVEIIGGHTVTRAERMKRVGRITVRPLGATGAAPGRSITCDLVCMSGGWSPAVHLFSQSGGTLRFDEASACIVPDEARQRVRAAGAANGAFGLGACLREGAAAGTAAAEAAGFTAAAVDIPEVADEEPQPILPLWRAPDDGRGGRAKCFVDFHTDVTSADIELAAREGYESVEHLKRYTTAGMGPDQGKTGNVNALALLAEARGVSISDVGTTTFRPPYTPVTYGALAGRDIGVLADPIRRTPMHAWHERAGAVFENVGQWKRAFYYPRRGEDKHAAVQREAKAARATIGLLDASTLGKIDIRGGGARDLLNLVYTNAWNKLEVGRCRYGLMLGEDGMVFDDGVTARLAEDHYLMTTTTGNAARVLGWMEEWLQCEWADSPVYLASVTTQWATVAVTGPGARRLLGELSEDVDLSPDAFPHMSVREGVVAGIAARIFRISYTGELSYEVNVPASAGLALWQALVTAGEKHGATPIGTEALHILRAEKGYIAVGQDTDGSVTPDDLGLGWAVSRKKDFLGRRSLSRPAIARKGRKQLVGLLTDDARLVLPEGAHIVAEVRAKPPMPMLGHVTSSYFSPNLGRSIAMALIENGRARMGEKVSLWVDEAAVRAEVTSPVFFDPDGGRLHA
ncbi:MAG: sarcosine oxidase subunit alpha, partial [Proteobacteria bacterium]|nr:sarcosine oxidase subunit alpha [Pseudomonadota bacterium]